MKEPLTDFKQVVLIDDDLSALFIHRHILEKRCGYSNRILEFINPLKALEALCDELSSSSHNVLVLLDVNMPEMSGFELLDSLGERGIPSESLYLAMVTSSLNDIDRKRALEHPLVDRFIVKPLKAEHLDAILSSPQPYSK